MTHGRPLHVGLLCSELFDPAAGGFGGFGFAALRFARVLGAAGPDRVRITAILPVPRPGPRLPSTLHGLPVVGSCGDRLTDARTYRQLGLDLVVAIDWQPNFLVPLVALPRVPVLLWMRDPRPPEEWDLIRTLRLPTDGPGRSDPGALTELEPGDNQRIARSLRWLLGTSRATGRPVEIAVPTLGLRDPLEHQYGIEPRRLWQLGTPLEPTPPTPGGRSTTGLHAVMLGRLDPVKRPWVMWALAAARPDWRFTVLGQAGTAAWTPGEAPPNLHHVGHAEGTSKAAVLASADVLVNTSIHEGLPVSSCEALAAGVALVGTTDVAGVVSRFGEVVPNPPGDGLTAVPALAAALDRLEADPDRRTWIADAAPRWVASVHAVTPFLAQLALLFDHLGVPEGARIARDLRGASSIEPRRVARGRPLPSRHPDFLVIGAARAGTTFLHDALRRHPGVFVPEEKEPRYFISDGAPSQFAGPYDDAMVNRRSTWSTEAYLAAFAGASSEQVAGEVSPLYLDTVGAAERIADALPGVRLVVVFRDPAERAHSQWRLQRQWGQESLSFPDALDREEERQAAGWSPLYAYRARGRYGALLAPYYDAVGADRILAVRFEDLVAASAATVASIAAFVGARGNGPEPDGRHNEASGVPRSRFVAEHLRGGVVPRVVTRLLGEPRAEVELARARRWNQAAARLHSIDRGDLVEGYQDDLDHLERLSGLDLALWRRPYE